MKLAREFLNKFVGLPFLLGGRDRSGIDCIGLIYLFLKEQGYQIELDERCSKEWMEKASFDEWKKIVLEYGEPIKYSELQPNDIMYFAWKDEIHAGVYIGYGKYLHINEKATSHISKLNESAKSRIIAIMRPSKTQKKIIPPAGRSFVQGLATVVGAVVGFAVGFFVGHPFIGAYIGASIGYWLTQPEPGNLEAGGDLAASPKYRFGGIRLTRSNDIPVALIYGLNRVGGNIIWHKGEEGEQTAMQFIGIGEGEVDSISNVRVNSVALSTLEGCSVDLYTGTATQEVDSRAAGEVKGLRYLAYAACTWIASDKLSSLPSKVTFEVRGLKVETWGGSSWVTTKTYSNNPAACIRDYLMRDKEIGGVGISTLNIDHDGFGEVYDYCAGQVSDGEGGLENRFELNYVIDTRRNAIDNLSDMLSSFGGYLIITGTTIKIGVKRSQSSVYDFTENNIKADSFTYSYFGKDDQINRIGVQYVDKDQEDTKPIAFVDDFSDQDDHGVREKIFPMYGIGRMSQAVRMAWQILYDLKLNPITIQFETDIQAMHIEPGDIIRVTHSLPNWTLREFLVTQIEEKEENEYTITATAYNSSLFNDSYGSGIMFYDYGSPPSVYSPPPDVDTFTVDSDGTNLLFDWDQVSEVISAPIKAYEIREGKNWDSATFVARVSANHSEYKVPIRYAGVRTFLIKARSEYGVWSANPGQDTITVTKVVGLNIILTEYLWKYIEQGSMSLGCQLVWTTHYDPSYYRKSITVKTQTTWENFETMGLTWDQIEAYDWDTPVVTTQQQFTFPEIDLGEIFEKVSTSITEQITGPDADIDIRWAHRT